MFPKIAVIFSFIFLVSSKCQKPTNDNNSNELVEQSHEKIQELLREKNFNILNNANSIIRYDIQKSLIEGTFEEYSNKVFLRDTLNKSDVITLINLMKSDSSYDWNRKLENVSFNPNKQFLIKSSSNSLTLIVDEKSKIVRFINVDGQHLIAVNKNLSLDIINR